MNQNYRAIGRSFLAWNDMAHFQFKKGLLQENGFKTGAVMVVNKTNIANLINEYKLFNSMGVGLKLNPIFIDGEAKQHVNDLGISVAIFVLILGIIFFIRKRKKKLNQNVVKSKSEKQIDRS